MGGRTTESGKAESNDREGLIDTCWKVHALVEEPRKVESRVQQPQGIDGHMLEKEIHALVD